MPLHGWMIPFGKRSRSVLLWAGAAGPGVFTAVYLAEGATRPGYDAVARPISDLSIGPGGWIQITDFVLLGLVMVGFAYAAGMSLTISHWTRRLLGLFGLGLITAGVFVTDPMAGYPPGAARGGTTFHGIVHQIASLLAFGSLPVAALLTAQHTWRTLRSIAWTSYSMVTAISMMVALSFFGHAMVSAGGVAGILERIAGTIGLSWVTVVAADAGSQQRANR